jgi:pimeloyl-ACP methyl ester carboxylesterase
MRFCCFMLLSATFLASSTTVSADESQPRTFITEHKTQIRGERIRYVATVEEYILKDEAGTPSLSLFATSYVRQPTRDEAKRPVVFIFNGGPSGASTGVHLELGPRQLKPGVSAEQPVFEDNPHSLLDVVDIVAFDPAESGFSRVLPQGRREYFYSIEGDTASLADLVEAWLRRHDRETSPRYLLGESYGSIRAVVTAELMQKRGRPLDGVVLVANSTPLMETSRRSNNIVSTAVSLPMLAMTARFHGKAAKTDKSDESFADEVYAFAMRDYLLALAQGHHLSASETQRIAARLADYTGISAEYYATHELAISKQDFNKELIKGQVLDANDTRLMQPAGSPPRERRDVVGAYLRSELQVDLPGLEYRMMAPDSFASWDWGNGCSEYLRTAGPLCSPSSTQRTIFVDYDWPYALLRCYANPRFRTFIVAGYYDGLSSFGTTRYMAARVGYPEDRFEVHEYAGGHATAGDPRARPEVMADLRAFFTGAR